MKLHEIQPSIRERSKLRAVLTILDQLNLEFAMVEPGVLPSLKKLAERKRNE